MTRVCIFNSVFFFLFLWYLKVLPTHAFRSLLYTVNVFSFFSVFFFYCFNTFSLRSQIVISIFFALKIFGMENKWLNKKIETDSRHSAHGLQCLKFQTNERTKMYKT